MISLLLIFWGKFSNPSPSNIPATDKDGILFLQFYQQFLASELSFQNYMRVRGCCFIAHIYGLLLLATQTS
jgi:hypothetical protein